jgi:histidine phosphotransfer protein HptB
MMATVDWQRVDDLATEIGADAMVEVVGMFLEETDAVIATFATGQPSTEDYHFLKGSALNLGLADLAALCQRGEAGGALQAETLVQYTAAKMALLDGIAARFGT